MNTILRRIIWLVILAPAVYLAIAWNRIPEQIPLQYDLSGQPSRIGNKTELIAGVAIITVISVLIYLFLPAIYRIDPKKNEYKHKPREQ